MLGENRDHIPSMQRLLPFRLRTVQQHASLLDHCAHPRSCRLIQPTGEYLVEPPFPPDLFQFDLNALTPASKGDSYIVTFRGEILRMVRPALRSQRRHGHVPVPRVILTALKYLELKNLFAIGVSPDLSRIVELRGFPASLAIPNDCFFLRDKAPAKPRHGLYSHNEGHKHTLGCAPDSDLNPGRPIPCWAWSTAALTQRIRSITIGELANQTFLSTPCMRGCTKLRHTGILRAEEIRIQQAFRCSSAKASISGCPFRSSNSWRIRAALRGADADLSKIADLQDHLTKLRGDLIARRIGMLQELDYLRSQIEQPE